MYTSKQTEALQTSNPDPKCNLPNEDDGLFTAVADGILLW